MSSGLYIPFRMDSFPPPETSPWSFLQYSNSVAGGLASSAELDVESELDVECSAYPMEFPLAGYEASSVYGRIERGIYGGTFGAPSYPEPIYARAAPPSPQDGRVAGASSTVHYLLNPSPYLQNPRKRQAEPSWADEQPGWCSRTSSDSPPSPPSLVVANAGPSQNFYIVVPRLPYCSESQNSFQVSL